MIKQSHTPFPGTNARLGSILIYSGVRVIASRILHEICLLIGELAIRGTKLTLNDRLWTKSNLLIEQLLLGEHYCSGQNLDLPY